VSPVKYELGFYIPEDAILHSHRRENLKSYRALTGFPSRTSSIIPLVYNVTEDCCPVECYAVWFLQYPHGVTSHKTTFFIVNAVKTKNPRQRYRVPIIFVGVKGARRTPCGRQADLNVSQHYRLLYLLLQGFLSRYMW
jgi:hypothetical protein